MQDCAKTELKHQNVHIFGTGKYNIGNICWKSQVKIALEQPNYENGFGQNCVHF